tara:strand:- start:2142 stop:2837 length:696 start_codon:yes stop_codon:yes gene_type:complete
MKNMLILLGICLMLLSCNDNKDETTAEDISNVMDISYAIGVDVSKGFVSNGISLDLDSFVDGFKSGHKGKSKFTDEEQQAILTKFQMELMKEKENDRKVVAEENLIAANDYLDVNKNKPGVKTTDSGLQYRVINEGNGKKPTAEDIVEVHYKGMLANGEEFDNSYKRKQPAQFPVNGVVPGWVEALQLMPVGSKWELYIPPNLGYGEYGKAVIPPNSLLIFEVELLKIVSK